MDQFYDNDGYNIIDNRVDRLEPSFYNSSGFWLALAIVILVLILIIILIYLDLQQLLQVTQLAPPSSLPPDQQINQYINLVCYQADYGVIWRPAAIIALSTVLFIWVLLIFPLNFVLMFAIGASIFMAVYAAFSFYVYHYASVICKIARDNPPAMIGSENLIYKLYENKRFEIFDSQNKKESKIEKNRNKKKIKWYQSSELTEEEDIKISIYRKKL